MDIHGVFRVAIAALARVTRLHRVPNVLRELEPMLVELFRRVDGPQGLMQELITGLDLPPDLEKPFMRHVAIGADRTHSELILEVNGLHVFLIHRVAHLMAGGAESQRIRRFHRPVEPAPEQNPPTPPKITNVARENRALGRQSTVQTRAMKLLRGGVTFGLLIMFPVVGFRIARSCSAARYDHQPPSIAKRSPRKRYQVYASEAMSMWTL